MDAARQVRGARRPVRREEGRRPLRRPPDDLGGGAARKVRHTHINASDILVVGIGDLTGSRSTGDDQRLEPGVGAEGAAARIVAHEGVVDGVDEPGCCDAAIDHACAVVGAATHWDRAGSDNAIKEIGGRGPRNTQRACDAGDNPNGAAGAAGERADIERGAA